MLTNKNTLVQAAEIQLENGHAPCPQSDSTHPLITRVTPSFNTGTETEQSTSPLQGYENIPLVSLEDATATLTDIVPDIALMVWTAKLNCSSPNDDLTSDESASIMLYTIEWTPKESSFCYFLDEALRSNDQQQLKPWFLYLKLIFHALTKLKSRTDTVYRGVKADVSAQYKKGDTFVSSEFTICAANVKTLENERGFDNKGTRTMFTIECQSGKDISRHSFDQTEDKILLMPGRRFHVVGCLNPGSELHIIQMKEMTS